MHSVYEGATNILFPTGIVSVVARSIGRGPLNVVLATNHVDFSQVVSKGDKARAGGNLLYAGPALCIYLERAGLFGPPARFRKQPLNCYFVRRNVETAQNLILAVGRLEGLGTLANPTLMMSRTEGSNPFVPPARRSALGFMRAFRQGNALGAIAAAKGLLGLGIGLTPSGDDLLSGLLVALVLGRRNGFDQSTVVDQIAEGVAESSRGRTTPLSQDYIQQAAAGRANEAVLRFVEDLYTGTRGNLSRSMADLIGYGATSGTDIAAGAILGVTLALDGEIHRGRSVAPR